MTVDLGPVIVRNYLAGKSINALAQSYAVHPCVVTHHLHEFGIEIIEAGKAVELYKKGLGTVEIGRRLGIGYWLVLKYLKSAGLKPTKRISLPSSIVARYKAGATLNSLAHEYRVDPCVVRRTLEEAGVPIRPRPGELETDDAQIVQRYTAGESIIEIAKTLKVDFSVVKTRLERAGVEIRSVSAATKVWAIKKQAAGEWPDRQKRPDITKKVLKRLYLKRLMTMDEIAKRLNCTVSTIHERIQKFGIPVRLFQPTKNSRPERDIQAKLDSLSVPYVCHFKLSSTERGKKPELDIALPDYKLGIEVNGCYFHACRTCGYEVYSGLQKHAVARDAAKRKILASMGWKLLELWLHEINDGSADTKLRDFLTAAGVPLVPVTEQPRPQDPYYPKSWQMDPKVLRQLYLVEGRTTNDIARMSGTTSTTVWRRLKQNGVVLRTQGSTLRARLGIGPTGILAGSGVTA